MAYQKQTYQDGVTEYTDTLYQHMDDGIFGAYPVQLIAISDTAPSQCVENDKYYNTSTKKIYTATGTNTWGTNGETPLEDTSYWLISENGNYAWDGTDLVSIGGGKAEVIISDTEPSDGKLWVDTAEIPTIAGRDRLVNVSNEVDEDYRVNLLKSNNLFDNIPVYYNNATKSDISNGVRITAIASYTSFALFKMIDVSNLVGKKISVKANFTSGGSYFIGLCDESGGNRIVGQKATTSGTTLTYTIPTITTSKYLALWLYAPSTANAYVDYTNIMVNEGTTSLPYSAFIPNQIKVNGNKYTDTLNVGTSLDSRSRVNVLHSKNLLNYNTSVNGIFTVNSTSETLDANNNAITSAWIPCEPNTTYRLYNPNGTSARKRWQTKASNGTITYMGETNTLTTNSTAKYMRVYYYVGSTATSPSSITNVQIEKGSEFTGFEPYITPSIYVDNEEIYSKPVVLWTNSSISSGMANATEINLVTNDYNYYEILYSLDNSNSLYISSGRIPKGKGTVLFNITGESSSPYFTGRQRNINYTNDTKLTSGQPNTFNTSGRNNNNNVCIPSIILGYK